MLFSNEAKTFGFEKRKSGYLYCIVTESMIKTSWQIMKNLDGTQRPMKYIVQLLRNISSIIVDSWNIRQRSKVEH